MNLINKLNKMNHTIQKIPINDLKNILSELYDDSHISNFIIQYKNLPHIIKCVKEYYKPKDNKKISQNTSCYNVQKKLGLNDSTNFTCKSCHLKCIDQFFNEKIDILK